MDDQARDAAQLRDLAEDDLPVNSRQQLKPSGWGTCEFALAGKGIGNPDTSDEPIEECVPKFSPTEPLR